MGAASHLRTWICALTSFQLLLHTCTAALTSSSVFPPSNVLSRFLPCNPAFTHTLKSHKLPVSLSCPELINATSRLGPPEDGFWTWPPYALFSMEDHPPEIINAVLQKAHDDPSVEQWYFYLATASYARAPQKSDDPISKHYTAAPIPSSFRSPFIGTTLADVADWLRRKPDSVNLDPHFFALLDKQAAKTGKVVVCRIGDKFLRGDEVTCMLWRAEDSTLTLVGSEFGDWDDMLAGNIGPYVPDI